MAEEARMPARKIGLIVIASIVVAATYYIGVLLSSAWICRGSKLLNSAWAPSMPSRRLVTQFSAPWRLRLRYWLTHQLLEPLFRIISAPLFISPRPHVTKAVSQVTS